MYRTVARARSTLSALCAQCNALAASPSRRGAEYVADTTQMRNYSSYNGAKRVVELPFSTRIPRARLRPSYAAGFQGAPLTCLSPFPHPDPRIHEQGSDSSQTTQASDPLGPTDL